MDYIFGIKINIILMAISIILIVCQFIFMCDFNNPVRYGILCIFSIIHYSTCLIYQYYVLQRYKYKYIFHIFIPLIIICTVMFVLVMFCLTNYEFLNMKCNSCGRFEVYYYLHHIFLSFVITIICIYSKNNNLVYQINNIENV